MKIQWCACLPLLWHSGCLTGQDLTSHGRRFGVWNPKNWAVFEQGQSSETITSSYWLHCQWRVNSPGGCLGCRNNCCSCGVAGATPGHGWHLCSVPPGAQRCFWSALTRGSLATAFCSSFPGRLLVRKAGFRETKHIFLSACLLCLLNSTFFSEKGF